MDRSSTPESTEYHDSFEHIGQVEDSQGNLIPWGVSSPWAVGPRPSSGIGAMNTTGLRTILKRTRTPSGRRLQIVAETSPTHGSGSNRSVDSGSDRDAAGVEDGAPPLSERSALRPSKYGNNSTYSAAPGDGVQPPTKPEPEYDTAEVLKELIFGNYINILLLATPFAVASAYLQWNPRTIFWLNFVAMLPLASLLGEFTEEVAKHTNPTIGGLINASFGNAVEVVVAVQALIADEYRVVQASMIGSILSNLLLVLGMCFFFGGLKYREQTFNAMVASGSISLLALSSIAMVLPTPFANYYDVNDEDVLGISRMVSVFLILMYIQLLIFQLKTHADAYEEDDEDIAQMSFGFAMFCLVVITAVISQLSQYLVDSIDGFCAESGISRSFVGIIILPIVGNAVEHIAAVTVAMKNKMDLAMGVAVGSATQISLFVTPLIVLIGWAMDKPMSLNYPHFEIILFVLSVMVVAIGISYPKSNWLEGSMLVTTYIMIAVGFWYEKVIPPGENGSEL